MPHAPDTYRWYKDGLQAFVDRYTGACAAECPAVDNGHINLANHRIVIPVSEEKMERLRRII